MTPIQTLGASLAIGLTRSMLTSPAANVNTAPIARPILGAASTDAMVKSRLIMTPPAVWPANACVHERHTGVLYAGMHSFALPLPIAPFTVSLLWHPRLDGDPAHRWLRGCVRGVCADPLPGRLV
jgi:hypothetical protein